MLGVVLSQIRVDPNSILPCRLYLPLPELGSFRILGFSPASFLPGAFGPILRSSSSDRRPGVSGLRPRVS